MHGLYWFVNSLLWMKSSLINIYYNHFAYVFDESIIDFREGEEYKYLPPTQAPIDPPYKKAVDMKRWFFYFYSLSQNNFMKSKKEHIEKLFVYYLCCNCVGECVYNVHREGGDIGLSIVMYPRLTSMFFDNLITLVFY